MEANTDYDPLEEQREFNRLIDLLYNPDAAGDALERAALMARFYPQTQRKPVCRETRPVEVSNAA